MSYKINDIIEYQDATWSDEFEDARQWAKSNNASLIELIDERKMKKIPEEYEETETEIVEVEIPEKSHYEEIFDDKTGKTKRKKIIDEKAHTEKKEEVKTVKKTREIEKLFRYFQIKPNSEE